MQGKKKAKRTWASAKGKKIRAVGDCLYCTKEITNDMSFIIFATKMWQTKCQSIPNQWTQKRE